jgi:hypothetical protein
MSAFLDPSALLLGGLALLILAIGFALTRLPDRPGRRRGT